MRNQDAPILSDVNEDNFDRAFELLRPGMQHPVCHWFVIDVVSYPVIQGTADVGKKLTKDELDVSVL